MTTSSVNSITNNVLSSSTGTLSSPASTTNSLNYNDFLNLLMTELQHQDPTQPMDPTQMVTQLATISQVGQSVQTNQTLSSMLISNSLSQAESIIGQNITSNDGKISGNVSSVNVSNLGTTATLSNGSTIQLSNGATIF